MFGLPRRRSRRFRHLVAGAAIASATAAIAITAAAGTAAADTTISFGSALSRAGVSAPRQVSLPVAATTARGSATVTDLRGSVRLRAGRRSVALTGLRVTTELRSQVAARVHGGTRRTLFTVSGSSLALTQEGARMLGRELKPKRTLRAGVVIGRIALDPGAATTAPDPAQATATGRPITAGTISWGYSPALRSVFQTAFTPLVSGGVAQSADGSFALPVTGGAYDAAARTGTVTSKGGFRIGYQVSAADGNGAHGIWVTLGNVAIVLRGSRGTLTASSESGYHGTPVVALTTRTIATVDLSTPPTASPDGNTLTWTAAPATIAPGGEQLVAAFQDAPGRPSLGDVKALDPVTITVQLAG
jgi:hypothetical protein